jgi:hypothetical protein
MNERGELYKDVMLDLLDALARTDLTLVESLGLLEQLRDCIIQSGHDLEDSQ